MTTEQNILKEIEELKKELIYIPKQITTCKMEVNNLEKLNIRNIPKFAKLQSIDLKDGKTEQEPK